MVHLPDKLSEEHIRTQFKRGDILKWESFKGKKETKDRFFILLTSPAGDPDILAVTATKRVELYADDGGKRRFRDFILVKKGSCKVFDRDTVIDLNWIEHFTIAEVSKLLGAGIVRAGALPVDFLGELDTKISKSSLISSDYKKRILGLSDGHKCGHDSV
ncbi:MAG: hypothetical protein KGI49_02170 [Patescibacteria group bacterium]|nr:hypothetical protein [Patescibacteria group bacterium]